MQDPHHDGPEAAGRVPADPPAGVLAPGVRLGLQLPGRGRVWKPGADGVHSSTMGPWSTHAGSAVAH